MVVLLIALLTGAANIFLYAVILFIQWKHINEHLRDPLRKINKYQIMQCREE